MTLLWFAVAMITLAFVVVLAGWKGGGVTLALIGVASFLAGWRLSGDQ
jgi:UPF0716 family protein affecting phage T7 exclusion